MAKNDCLTVDELVNRYPNLASCRNDIECALDTLIDCYENDGKVLVCGNGGSASDSEHIVGELMKSFKRKRQLDQAFVEQYKAEFSQEPPAWLEGALPAISLVSHTSLSTAFSNDEASEGVFAQQVYGYGRQGDVLMAISTSGNSRNVIEAAKVATAKGLSVVALTGIKASQLDDVADVCIKVPESETYKIQELHLPVYHALCAALEAAFFDASEAESQG